MSLFLASLGKIILTLGTDFARHKMADRKSLSKAKQLRLAAAAKSHADWQAFMADASANSWKDEAWMCCFIIILGMCFIPSLQGYVAEGFAILDDTPHWFQWACLAPIGASFGLLGFDKFQQKTNIPANKDPIIK